MADLLTSAAAKGHHLGSTARVLGQMLDHYGASAMQEAVLEALRRDVPYTTLCDWPWSVRARTDRTPHLSRRNSLNGSGAWM
jgi:uncharacterized protein YbaA (DUF1428 family)